MGVYKSGGRNRLPVSRIRLFGSLCSMVFLINLPRVIFAPLLQPLAADFGVAAASLGVVASAAWLGSAVPRLPTGYLLTKVPRHHVVVGTGALLVATSTYTGFAQSVDHLTFGAFLMGLSSGCYFIAANPLVSELFPERIGRAIGIHGMSSQIAAVSAPLIITGILLFADWRTTFFVIALASGIATAALALTARRADLPRISAVDLGLLDAAMAQWPLILTGIFIISTVGFLWNGLFNLYGDYLESVKDIPPGIGRLLLSLMFVAGVPAWIITGGLADRWPQVPMMVVILLGFGAAVVGLTLVDGVVLVAACSVLIGYLFFSLPAVLDTYLLSSLPNRHRGSAYTWFSSMMTFTTALGSGVIGTVVARRLPYDTVFQILAGGVVATGVVLLGLYLVGALSSRRQRTSA